MKLKWKICRVVWGKHARAAAVSIQQSQSPPPLLLLLLEVMIIFFLAGAKQAGFARAS